MSYTTAFPVSAGRLIGKGNKPKYGADYTQLKARDKWVVDFADLAAFLQVVYGTIETISVGGTLGTISRLVPLRYKDDTRLLAVDVDADYEGWNRVTNNFAKAIVTIDYSTVGWDLLGQYAFVEITGDPEERTENISASGITIGGERPAFDGSFWLPGTAYTFTLHYVPFLSDATYQTLYKNVNSGTFRGCPAETVLYMGASFKNMSKFGVTYWDVTHKFLVSPISWNKGYKRDGSLGDKLVNGSKFYPASDLSQLFYL